MTTTRPGPWCCRIAELAARVLPAGQRDRYAREFVAELYGMSRSRQLGYALQLLACAWALRSALRTSPTSSEETSMTAPTRKPLKCLLGLHVWDPRTNQETAERFEICLRCDAYRERTSDASGAAS